MKTWFTALAIAALTSLVCALIVATSSRSSESPTSAPRASAPGARIPARHSSHEDSALPEERPLADEASEAAPAAGATPPAPEVTTEVVATRLADSFRDERQDPSWDSGEATRLERALPAHLPSGSRLLRVECRSTLCRIESSHEGVTQFADFARSSFLMENRVNEGPFFASVTSPVVAGQPVTTVAYVARKGHILPMSERIATAQ